MKKIETDYHKESLDLSNNEDRFRTLVDSLPFCVHEIDLNGKLLSMNTAGLCMINETDEKSIVNVPYMDFVADSDTEKVSTLMQQAIEGKASNFEFEASGGAKLIFASCFVPMQDNNGKVYRLMGYTQDITERKQAEESRFKFEKQLQQAQKLESLGILAGGLAHDFNNILTMLFGNISLAKNNTPKENKVYKHLENAEGAFQRATRLTNQLLTFSKGGLPIKKDINLHKVIEEVTLFDLAGSNVKLVFKGDKNLLSINADEGQIEQVFTNLVINANQAMPDGGNLYITIDNIEQEKSLANLNSGPHVKITVQDEGIGISTEQLDQVFDPYFSTKDDGIGLGLATVYSIIKKHDGHIEIASELGKGTTFTIYLPAIPSYQSLTAKQNECGVLNNEQFGKILVMDDEIMICDLTKDILESKGYLVEAAAGGEQAISLYQQSLDDGHPFDCIIMDLTIPGGIGGKETIAEILKLNPEVKAIVSSGYTADAVMSDYTDFGFKGVLPKPFTEDSLFRAVNSVLM